MLVMSADVHVGSHMARAKLRLGLVNTRQDDFLIVHADDPDSNDRKATRLQVAGRAQDR